MFMLMQSSSTEETMRKEHTRCLARRSYRDTASQSTVILKL